MRKLGGYLQLMLTVAIVVSACSPQSPSDPEKGPSTVEASATQVVEAMATQMIDVAATYIAPNEEGMPVGEFATLVTGLEQVDPASSEDNTSQANRVVSEVNGKLPADVQKLTKYFEVIGTDDDGSKMRAGIFGIYPRGNIFTLLLAAKDGDVTNPDYLGKGDDPVQPYDALPKQNSDGGWTIYASLPSGLEPLFVTDKEGVIQTLYPLPGHGGPVDVSADKMKMLAMPAALPEGFVEFVQAGGHQDGNGNWVNESNAVRYIASNGEIVDARGFYDKNIPFKVSQKEFENYRRPSGVVMNGGFRLIKNSSYNTVDVADGVGSEVLIEHALSIWNNFNALGASPVSLADYEKLLKKVQSGTATEEEVKGMIVNVPYFNVVTGKYEQVPAIFFPGQATLPENVISINRLQDLYYNGVEIDKTGSEVISPTLAIPGYMKVYKYGDGYGFLLSTDGTYSIVIGGDPGVSGLVAEKRSRMAGRSTVATDDFIDAFELGSNIPNVSGSEKNGPEADNLVGKGFKIY